MHRFGKKNLVLAGIVVSLLAMLTIAMRSSIRTAGAETGNAVQERNVRIQEAFRMAEER